MIMYIENLEMDNNIHVIIWTIDTESSVVCEGCNRPVEEHNRIE